METVPTRETKAKLNCSHNNSTILDSWRERVETREHCRIVWIDYITAPDHTDIRDDLFNK